MSAGASFEAQDKRARTSQSEDIDGLGGDRVDLVASLGHSLLLTTLNLG